MAIPVVDRGSGPPIVLVPGIHGRWEYFRPTVDALSQFARVIAFSLQDGSRRPSLDTYADQVDRVLAERAISRAIVCGVSFGGLIALRLAAWRPARVPALVLVSTPGPGFRLPPATERYARRPWLAPLFLAGAPRRLRDEIRAALPQRTDRWRFNWQQLQTLVRAPLSPWAMAARARLIEGAQAMVDSRAISTPTLVLCGEPSLDRVVSVESSRQYLQEIAGARLVTLERTGHLGCVTRPQAFAAAVREFVARLELFDAA